MPHNVRAFEDQCCVTGAGSFRWSLVCVGVMSGLAKGQDCVSETEGAQQIGSFHESLTVLIIVLVVHIGRPDSARALLRSNSVAN